MISVEDARIILADDRMSDGDVKETIDTLQLLVELMFDKWLAEQKAKKVVDELKTVTSKKD